MCSHIGHIFFQLGGFLCAETADNRQSSFDGFSMICKFSKITF